MCYELRQEVPATAVSDQYKHIVDNVWDAGMSVRTALGTDVFIERVVATTPNKKVDGYRVLGTHPGATDDLVVWLYRKWVDESPSSVGTAMDSLVAVAEERNSETLLTEVAMERSQGRLGDKEIKDAYAYFGFYDPDVDDGLLAGVYQVKLSDEPQEQATHKMKMAIIAESRASKALEDLVLGTGKLISSSFLLVFYSPCA